MLTSVSSNSDAVTWVTTDGFINRVTFVYISIVLLLLCCFALKIFRFLF